MVLTELPIAGGFYRSRSLTISDQQCLNFYVHINQRGGLSQKALYGTPGLKEIANTGTIQQINRGAHVMAGIPYFVNGNDLYRVIRNLDSFNNESFTTEFLGSVEGSGRVSMSDNGNQLMVLVPRGKGYIYEEGAGSPFQEITDPDFRANGNPEYVTFVNGAFLLTTDEKKFIISALNDGLSYNALDFGSAEADPDKIVAPVVVNNQLYICGSETIEPFIDNSQNTGADFPWQRIQGGVVSVGVFAPFSLISAAGTFFFVGGAVNESPSIYAFSNGGPSVISHDGINLLLEELTENELSEVFAFTYSENGARFVGFTLPTTTIVYDLVSQEWHERQSTFNENGSNRQDRWRVNSIVKAYSRILCGDKEDGRIGELKLSHYSEYGNPIISSVSTKPFSNLGQRLLVPYVELTTESGVGNDDAPDPKVWLNVIRDGKVISDNFITGLGKRGEHNRRQIWRQLGRFDPSVGFKFTISDRVKKVLIKLEADIL